MNYFFDTSALVKVYHRESGTDIVLPIYKRKDQIFISEISNLEFVSTFYRKFRSKEIDKNLLAIIKDKFFSDIQIDFIFCL